MSDVLCNMCGLSCDLPTGPLDNPKGDAHGLIEQEVLGHYASTPGNGHGALDDTTAYKFSLCEWCLDWLFDQFKVPPTVREWRFDGGRGEVQAWRPASERVAEDEWRRFKSEFYAEATRRTIARSSRS